MQNKVIPLNYTYLAHEIDELADKLAMQNAPNKCFKNLLSDYVPTIVINNINDCYDNHLELLKPYIEMVYNMAHKPAQFKTLIFMALSEYINEKIIEHIDIVAYNYLINYVNANSLNKRVSYEMIETIAHGANEYTSPQELVDNLHSYLDD